MNTPATSLSPTAVDPIASVMYRGERTMLRNVPLGKEFIVDGRVFQSSLGSPTKFATTPINMRFKFGDEWCIRVSAHVVRALEVGLPFGHVSSKNVRIESEQNVRHLVIDDRGAA